MKVKFREASLRPTAVLGPAVMRGGQQAICREKQVGTGRGKGINLLKV